MSAVVEKNASASLHGSSDALALARLSQGSRPAVVFCAQATEAQRLKDEIAWFAPQLSALLLPDWETLPYDHFSPHHDLRSEEHTSELQSQSNLVCRLLLEKKKTDHC